MEGILSKLINIISNKISWCANTCYLLLQNIATIDAPKLEEAVIAVKLPEIILDVIGTHGTGTISC